MCIIYKVKYLAKHEKEWKISFSNNIYIYRYGKNVESYISQVILTTKKIEDGFNYSYE